MLEDLGAMIRRRSGAGRVATAVVCSAADGGSGGNHDLTEEFGIEARNCGLVVTEVRTT